MSGTVQKAAEMTVSKRYEALLRVSQTLISIRSSDELFSILARELRAVVNFYVMEVGFLSLVANQVALAVDDALNFDTSQHATEALRASEEGYRLIVDSIPAFAWYAGTDGKIEYLNQRILDFTGVRLKDLVGFGWANVLHPQDVERTKKAWLHSIATGEPCDVDQRVRRFDNVYCWFRTNAQPLRDPSGRVIRWYGIATEIEDLKRAEEGLREREQNLRLVVDSIPGLVCTTTAEGELEFVNGQVLDY